MRKYFGLIAGCLILCLFIYLFYRTERTLVDYLVLQIMHTDTYFFWRDTIQQNLQLPAFIIYSLPEALWVFCITLLSRFFFIPLRGKRLSLSLIPLFGAVGLEFLQLWQLRPGRFDVWDITGSFLFWLFALMVPITADAQNLFQGHNTRHLVLYSSYAIVYLAHVLPV